ncbi:hypothetical protein [Natronoglomus mannanivorans]|uniref:CHAT domain-containing protein n=1 Tax=Natronoglomus mannanivorans TaxID=2979990 RepID=A0AAP2Z2R0_9EURY|nr:hypothetical protein [Halobacteria archaeon AArc-xg1-1]
MNPTYHADDDRPELTVVDPVQNTRYPLKTTDPVEPVPTDPDCFYFPVESAIAFTTEKLVLPYVVPTVVRDREGTMLLETEHYAYETLPEGEYILELMAPIRLSVRVRGAVTIASSDERLAIAFGESTRVRLGARSLHERPAGTVTTTGAPDDLARAVSTFGSALKTLSCERSLPTFRGHPPRLELGDELRIPEGLEPPESGVTIVVPPERTAVYAVSSLAYYLGATVVTGANPRIETDHGFEYALGEAGVPFERSVERVLKHVFFLDCLTRTEGLYRIDLYERQQVDDRLNVAFDELYDEPLAEQLETYLSIPFEAIADLQPAWQLATHVTPERENATVLPFLADDLSIVATAPDSTPEIEGTGDDSEEKPDPDPDLDSDSESTSADDIALAIDGFTRSTAETNGDRRNRLSIDAFVSPPDLDAFEQAWLGDGIPIGANKLVPDAFENGLERSPSGDDVEITIVCNDDRMLDELDGTLYGDREELPFDVSVHRDCSVATLRSLIAAETDFFHYVGHVEDGAFVCHDGVLETESLVDVGVETFLLNGCQSYELGIALLEAGSTGGIVTVSDVGNPDAVAVGRLIARLLNTGFTLRSAVDVARSYRLVGNQYVVVGDGGSSVTQSGGGVPNICRIEAVTEDGRGPRDDGEGHRCRTNDEVEAENEQTDADANVKTDTNADVDANANTNTNPDANANNTPIESPIGRYRIQIRLYHSSNTGVGALYIPYIDGIDQYFLVGGELPLLELSGYALTRFFQLEEIPVEWNGEHYWSSDAQFENL